MNYNKGYIGLSMSIRAQGAYEDGLKPFSKWRKQDIIQAIKTSDFSFDIDFDKLEKCNLETLKKYCLECVEWHHTGNHFKKTNFFDISEEGVKKLIQNDYQNVPPKHKEDVKESDYYVHGKMKHVFYHPYSKHHKYEEYWETFKNGKIKGQWVVFEDGSKKKRTNVKVEKTTKEKI